MPCTDGGPSCGFGDHITLACHKEELAKVQDKLDYVTSMLCAVMDLAAKAACSGGSKVTWADKLVETHPGLPKWWADHKKKDAKEKAIRDAEHQVKLAMHALKKLREE